MGPAAGLKDGESLAPQFVGEEKRLGDLVFGGGRRQVDGFRYAAVAVSLEAGLHADMMLGSDIMSRDKQAPEIRRKHGEVLDGRPLIKGCSQTFHVEACGPRQAEEGRVDGDQPGALHDGTDRLDGIERLDSGEHPAMMLMVPVGAIVVTVALRRRSWRLWGKLPR